MAEDIKAEDKTTPSRLDTAAEPPDQSVPHFLSGLVVGFVAGLFINYAWQGICAEIVVGVLYSTSASRSLMSRITFGIWCILPVSAAVAAGRTEKRLWKGAFWGFLLAFAVVAFGLMTWGIVGGICSRIDRSQYY